MIYRGPRLFCLRHLLCLCSNMTAQNALLEWLDNALRALLTRLRLEGSLKSIFVYTGDGMVIVRDQGARACSTLQRLTSDAASTTSPRRDWHDR